MTVKFLHHKYDTDFNRISTEIACELPNGVSQAIFMDDDTNFRAETTHKGPVYCIHYSYRDRKSLLRYLMQGLVDVAEHNLQLLKGIEPHEFVDVAVTVKNNNDYAEHLMKAINAVVGIMATENSQLEIVISEDFWSAT